MSPPPGCQAAGKIYIDGQRPQACEAAGIARKRYINAQGRKLGESQAELMTGSQHMPGTKKMCKYLAKFAKIDATVKQLAGNKRTQKDESIRSTRRRGRTI